MDAGTLRDAMARFRRALEDHREELNSLNVYPVPDGDTGTNMLRTQQSVDDELAKLDGADLHEVTSAIARSALMGARGNSGVILAQALRGFGGSFDRRALWRPAARGPSCCSTPCTPPSPGASSPRRAGRSARWVAGTGGWNTTARHPPTGRRSSSSSTPETTRSRRSG